MPKILLFLPTKFQGRGIAACQHLEGCILGEMFAIFEKGHPRLHVLECLTLWIQFLIYAMWEGHPEFLAQNQRSDIWWTSLQNDTFPNGLPMQGASLIIQDEHAQFLRCTQSWPMETMVDLWIWSQIEYWADLWVNASDKCQLFSCLIRFLVQGHWTGNDVCDSFDTNADSFSASSYCFRDLDLKWCLYCCCQFEMIIGVMESKFLSGFE